MAKQHHNLLVRLEQVGLNRYQVTEDDIQMVEQYLNIIQTGLEGETTWEEMVRYAGPYGTSILIHEVVEIRMLEKRGLQPLRQKTRQLRQLLRQNVDAHIAATYEEHRYLQEVINRLYGLTFEVATLIMANRSGRELQMFLESDIGIFLLEEGRVAEAKQVLTRLKGKADL